MEGGGDGREGGRVNATQPQRGHKMHGEGRGARGEAGREQETGLGFSRSLSLLDL